VCEERSFGGLIRLVKSPWNKISSDHQPDPETKRIVIPLYAPQAYPDGLPFGKPRASSPAPELELENRENGSP
jgi:hypothetical protein